MNEFFLWFIRPIATFLGELALVIGLILVMVLVIWIKEKLK